MDLSIARKLLWSGAHPHGAKNSRGQYPLQVALLHRRGDLALLLISMCALRGISMEWELMELPPDQIQHCIQLFSECEEQILRMKAAPIEGSRLSFYDVAGIHPSKAAQSLRVEDLRRALSSMPVSFPHYAELIAFRLGRLEERRVLHDRCLECCLRPPQWPPLPLSCMDALLLSLSNCDLHNFARAFESGS